MLNTFLKILFMGYYLLGGDLCSVKVGNGQTILIELVVLVFIISYLLVFRVVMWDTRIFTKICSKTF